MALVVGSRTKRQGRTELFWAVDRLDRYRVCAELIQIAGHVVIVCRNQADASRVAKELSRHGVPAASVEHRDFSAPHVRAQVVTDETALSCARNGTRCVIQFDPATGPRRYRRRVDLLASPRAVVVTLVVPERAAEAHALLADLDLPDVLTAVDLSVAYRGVSAAGTDDTAPGTGTADQAVPRERAVPRRALAKVSGSVRQVFGAAWRRVRDHNRHRGSAVTSSPSGDEAAFHGDQRAS